MLPSDAAGSSPENTAECEAAILLLEKRKQDIEARVRELRTAEDIRAGRIYAAEIFNLLQEKHRLETEALVLRNRLKRLHYGQEK